MDRSIRAIVIVGGGTAGWMAAAALKRAVGPAIRVTLVESADIGVIGVGEATVPAIRQFNAMIGLDEAEFMRETMATFKLGIEFVDWGETGRRYFHPFGAFGPGPDLGGFHQGYLMARRNGLTTPLEAYSICARAAAKGRMARPSPDPRSPLAAFQWAYHFDAILYARHLRRFSEALGVVRLEADVEGATLRPDDGFIQSLNLADGGVIEGDLFIDCTGFRGLLIEGILKTGYEDWSHWLPMDRAVAVPCEKVEPVKPFTRSTAREAGWQWRIPLQHRTGNGYVFASQFVSEDAATAVLLANLDGRPLAEPRVLRFATGRRRQFWNRNVVALGLASGFLEPLESTSIHMIHSGITRLLQHFPDRDFSPVNTDAYNVRGVAEAELIRDFIILHYHATIRVDAPLWAHARTMTIPETLRGRIALFADRGLLTSSADELFSHSSWLAVMWGQGVTPRSYNPLYGRQTTAASAGLEQVARGIEAASDALPDHDDFLAANGLAASGAIPSPMPPRSRPGAAP